MASSKISELTDGTQFEPGDETIVVRSGVNWKVDPTKNAVQAWVNFDGTGTVAIRASYNVSSITDNGTGNYTVNFTNALTDANFAGFLTPGSVSAGNDTNNWYSISQTSSTYQIYTSYGAAIAFDYDNIQVAIIR